jgi:hypothetical protein
MNQHRAKPLCRGNVIGTVVSLCGAAVMGTILTACGGSDSGDASVRLSEAPAGTSPGGSAGSSSGTNAAVDTSKLVSPVSQAPVGRQTMRDVRVPQGQDANPPRHP